MNATARRALVMGAVIVGLALLFLLVDWPPVPDLKHMR